MIALPTDARKYTDECERFVRLLNARFPDVATMGIYNRRHIAGTYTWSQHAWGNAVDITSPANRKPRVAENELHMAYLDEVYDWIRANSQRLEVRVILWRRASHWNHIHVDFYPRQTGTPPVLTGDPQEEAQVKEWIETVQASLNKAGYKGANGKALTVDGILGANTKFAMEERDRDAAASVDIELDVDTVRVVRGVTVAAT